MPVAPAGLEGSLTTQSSQEVDSGFIEENLFQKLKGKEQVRKAPKPNSDLYKYRHTHNTPPIIIIVVQFKNSKLFKHHESIEMSID